MSRGKKKELRPSEKRYNKRVPPTAFRIDNETVKKLYELFEASKAETWGIFFKGLVGDVELKLKSIEEAKKAGYELGLRNAKLWYGVSYPCAKCGHTIFVSGPRQIAQVRELIVQAALTHSACPKLNLPKPTPSSITVPKPNPPTVPVEKSANQDKISRFLQE